MIRKVGIGLILFGFLFSLQLPGAAGTESHRETAKTEVRTLRDGISLYRLKQGRLPKRLDDLVAAEILKKIPKDPWSRPYVWMRPMDDGPGCLLSAGRDGRPGTEDDVGEPCDLRLDTRLRLMDLRGAIAMFRIRTSRWPRTLREVRDANLIDDLPKDRWDHDFLWMRPAGNAGRGCLLSMGSDGRAGTADDLVEGCDLELLNQHLLVKAGLDAAADRIDAYGNPIQLLPAAHTFMTWSYGADGKPDTEDDQVARVRSRD